MDRIIVVKWIAKTCSWRLTFIVRAFDNFLGRLVLSFMIATVGCACSDRSECQFICRRVWAFWRSSCFVRCWCWWTLRENGLFPVKRWDNDVVLFATWQWVNCCWWNIFTDRCLIHHMEFPTRAHSPVARQKYVTISTRICYRIYRLVKNLLHLGREHIMTMTMAMKYFLLPWSYIMFIQYTKQHTCNHYTIFTSRRQINVQYIKKKNW